MSKTRLKDNKRNNKLNRQNLTLRSEKTHEIKCGKIKNPDKIMGNRNYWLDKTKSPET